ncbi:MAG: Uncharacterised protein [Flavobacteriaceae bacterium]|nr:hypothetical protein [Schleiferiaceae bacterium]CAI8176812.1 MAG: Uncharacterised protein [Flavobacteriaceae bacterium]
MSLLDELKYRNIIGTARYVSKVYFQIKKVRGIPEIQDVIDYILLNRYSRKEFHQSKLFESVIVSLDNSLGKIGLKDITVAILITETPYMHTDLRTRMEWDDVMNQVFFKLGFTPELIGSVIDLKFDRALEKILEFEFFNTLDNKNSGLREQPVRIKEKIDTPKPEPAKVEVTKKPKAKPKKENSIIGTLLLIVLLFSALGTIGSLIKKANEPKPVYDWNSKFDSNVESTYSKPIEDLNEQEERIPANSPFEWSEEAKSYIKKYRELHPVSSFEEDDLFIARKIIEAYPELEKLYFP